MVEWIDVEGQEWTDLLAPEWIGDLSVSVGESLALAITGPLDVIVQYNHTLSVTGAIPLLASMKEATVQVDCAVTLDAPIATLALAPKEATTKSDCTVTMAAAPSLSLAVLEHVADKTTRVDQTLIQMTMTVKNHALSITSEITQAAPIEMVLTPLEISHVGVVVVAEQDISPVIQTEIHEPGLIIDPVFDYPSAIPLTLTAKEPGVVVSSLVTVAAPLVLSMTLKTSAPQAATQVLMPAPIPMALTAKEPVFSAATVVQIGEALSLSLSPKTAAAHHDNRAVLGQAIPITAAMKPVSVSRSPVVSIPGPLSLTMAVRAAGTQFNHTEEIPGLVGTMAMTMNEPAAVTISSAAVVLPIPLTFEPRDVIVSIDAEYDQSEPLEIVVAVLLPEYYGPNMPEVLVLDSFITREIVIESDLDIRMSEYG